MESHVKTKTVYTVFEYYRKLAVFETTNYADALQVAQWNTMGGKVPPEEQIVAHVELAEGYQNFMCFWMPGEQTKNQKRLNELVNS